MQPSLRTLLILGRISNLPTVWSNCLAGWWLGGAGNYEDLPFLLAGATCLYTGGMFLNDAMDAEFDRLHRKERPVPSGAIGLEILWKWGLSWLALGGLCLIWLGPTTGCLGVLLILSILLYDAVHKRIRFGPILMAICRFLLYVIAASVANNGVTGRSIWCGLALALYIVGLSFFARGESVHHKLHYWPAFLMAAPVILALLIDNNDYREAGLLLSAVLVLWTLLALRQTLWSNEPKIGLTVSWLLAGIVLVDWLAVADAPRLLCGICIVLFLTALLLQRFVPAT
jgi:4-hydroxybenzoate polyprenyltransferase